MPQNKLTQLLSRQLLRKVPELTIFFWIIKILTTAMGESFSDYLVQTFNPVIAVALGGLGFIVILALQLSTSKYIAWMYWLTVVMVAIFGTMAADVLHVGIGIPYSISTAFFSILLLLIFIAWYKKEKTLSIHRIDTTRSELFYWATVVSTFALGTAAGDLTASTFNLGYLNSGILFGILFAIPAIAYLVFGLNEIFAFWFAYIITRPLGASFADWFGKSALGGLGFGDAKVTIVLTILIVLFVAYIAISRVDSKKQSRKVITRN
jgi:uncharacterized membrane-anchored protein